MEDRNQLVACELCSARFAVDEDLRNHMLLQHPDAGR